MDGLITQGNHRRKYENLGRKSCLGVLPPTPLYLIPDYNLHFLYLFFFHIALLLKSSDCPSKNTHTCLSALFHLNFPAPFLTVARIISDKRYLLPVPTFDFRHLQKHVTAILNTYSSFLSISIFLCIFRNTLKRFSTQHTLFFPISQSSSSFASSNTTYSLL